MPRTPRSYLPGAVFHLTARTQGHAPWFTDRLRPHIAEYAASSLRVSDAQLLAWAIMPNHLHLIVRQGAWPLGRVMSPVLTRVALLVQRAHSLEGHVFERRFHDVPCHDPEHVRNAIVYTHLNPVRAGLAGELSAYPWTSHPMYAAADSGPSCMEGVLRVGLGLRLFAHREGLSAAGLRRAYSRHVEWRIERDRQIAAETLGFDIASPSARPRVLGGRRGWSHTFAPLFRNHKVGCDEGAPPPASHDLRDIAKGVLAELELGISLDRVRSNCKERTVVRARRAMVLRMSDAGHTGLAIARYLRVSPQCVSNILTRHRRGRR